MLITRTAVAGLAPSLDGHVITPEDVGYDESRQAFNLSIDLRPAAVVIAHSAQDVAATVRFAASWPASPMPSSDAAAMAESVFNCASFRPTASSETWY